MAPQTLAARMDSLEARVTLLEQLPARLDALALQVSQLRDEMRSEFSAVCGDIQAGDEETRRSLRDEIRTGDEETRRSLRDEIRTGDEETRRSLRDEIRTGDEETRRSLRDEIRTGDEETRRTLRDEIRAGLAEVMTHARVLHEDQKATIALIAERLQSLTESRGSS
jgi:uncharacterized coiled-coil protein SlyX